MNEKSHSAPVKMDGSYPELVEAGVQDGGQLGGISILSQFEGLDVDWFQNSDALELYLKKWKRIVIQKLQNSFKNITSCKHIMKLPQNSILYKLTG